MWSSVSLQEKVAVTMPLVSPRGAVGPCPFLLWKPEMTMERIERGLFKLDRFVITEVTSIGTEEAHLLQTQCFNMFLLILSTCGR